MTLFTRVSALVAAGLAAVSLSGCSHTVAGHGAMKIGAAQQVAATAQDTPSPVTSTPAPPRELTLDELVHAVNSDATEYWKDNGASFPAMKVVETSATNDCLKRDTTMSQVCDGVLYYRADLLGQLHRTHGDVVITEVIAHEVGHALLHYTDSDKVSTVTLETRADCASGAYTAEKFSGVSEDRARELFSKTALNDPGGEGDASFTIGFRTQRRGQNVETMCTTYDYAR